MSWPKGPMKYNLAIAMELPRFAPISYTIELDTQLLQVEAMLIAVANGKSYGGGMQVCPDASMTDGLFDVMSLHPTMGMQQRLRARHKSILGTHTPHPLIDTSRARSIEFSSAARSEKLRIDGRRIRSWSKVQVEIVPDYWRLLV